ncbi:uncharacterized protein LOC135217392 [Macrobrachium nipponense]|uniref:uncharacterized protein LOC135217392 n=1 Tax=Macrobrachium nipponense TaxID=159736 RepID=UPI0030C83A39
MRRGVILMSLAAIALAQDGFFDKYSFTKTMASCFGEDLYYDYLVKTGIAQRECLQLPVSSLHRLDFSRYPQFSYPLHLGGDSNYVPFPSYYPGHSGHYGVSHRYQPYHYRKKRETDQRGVVEEPPLNLEVVEAEPQKQVQPQDKALQPLKPYFDKYYLLDSVNKIMAALSNYTCTLHKLGVIDKYLNLRTTHLIDDYGKLPLSDSLKKDLAEGLFYCRDLTYCLPLDKPRSPLPLNLQRLLMAMKCEKETRTNACFKEDLRRNIEGFDLSLFPRDETLDSKVNKLAAIVVGVDSLNELDVM